MNRPRPRHRGTPDDYPAGGQVRDGAWVAELTGLLDLAGWPAGMRVILRKERPHPGAQLRFTDLGGHRCAHQTSPEARSIPTRKIEVSVLGSSCRPDARKIDRGNSA